MELSRQNSFSSIQWIIRCHEEWDSVHNHKRIAWVLQKIDNNDDDHHNNNFLYSEI